MAAKLCSFCCSTGGGALLDLRIRSDACAPCALGRHSLLLKVHGVHTACGEHAVHGYGAGQCTVVHCSVGQCTVVLYCEVQLHCSWVSCCPSQLSRITDHNMRHGHNSNHSMLQSHNLSHNARPSSIYKHNSNHNLKLIFIYIYVQIFLQRPIIVLPEGGNDLAPTLLDGGVE